MMGFQNALYATRGAPHAPQAPQRGIGSARYAGGSGGSGPGGLAPQDLAAVLQANLNRQEQARQFDAGLGFQRDQAGLTAALQREQNALQGQLGNRRLDVEGGLGGRRIDADMTLGKMQNQTQLAGIERQYELGVGNQANERRGQDIGSQTARYQADVAAATARFPVEMKERRWQQLFPYLEGLLSGGQDPYTIGGQTRAPGAGAPRQVYTDEQVNQQVNDSRARGAQGTATRVRDMRQSLAGRGLGANSPLSAALESQMQAANLMNQLDQERQLRFDVAGANSQQGLAAAQLDEARRAAMAGEDIERARPHFAQQNALLALLGQLAG
jgi:hypothetical protein